MEVPFEIQGRYIERRKHDLRVCMMALEQKKFSELETTGHQLKGNGSTFGFPELSSIGKKLEVGAQTQDLHLLKETMKEFSNWLSGQLN